jgi:drug/metabolite transporter (DMT)-like permease
MIESPKIISPGVRYMILSVILFAVGHAAVKWVSHIPFYQLVFLRAVITAVLCLGIIKWRGISMSGHNRGLLLLRGLAGTVALTSYFYSLQNMPLASAVTIQYLSPILTLFIAHFLLKERATRSQLLFFLMAFIGVLMVKGFDARVSTTALTVSFISVVTSAFAYNFVRMLRDFDHELIVVLYFPLVTIPLVGPFALYTWVWPSARDWFFILIIGVFTQAAQVFMTMAYQREKAADVAIYNYLGLIIALAAGYYGFGETFSLLSTIGMIVILVAVLLSTAKLKR